MNDGFIKNGDMPISPLVNEWGHPLHCSQIALDNWPLAHGLTKREHLAAMAMQGLLSGGYCIDDAQNRLTDVSLEAVAIADALLSALEPSK